MSTLPRTMQLVIVGQEAPYPEYIRTDRYTIHPFDAALGVVPSASIDALVVIASDDLQSQLNVARCAFPRPPLILIVADEFFDQPSIFSPSLDEVLGASECTSHRFDTAVRLATIRQHHRLDREETEQEFRGQVQELLLSNHKLSRRVKKQRHLSRNASRLVDHVSHELRTPLAVISDYVSILQRGLAGDMKPEQKMLLDTISVRVNDMNVMVEDMLDVSRMKSQSLCVRRRKLHPEAVVDRILPAIQRKAALRKIDLVVNAATPQEAIFGDEEKLGRAVSNLAMNAIKFCGEPGKVTISTCDEGDFVRFRVRDNGRGIPSQERRKLFRRFQQCQSTSNATVNFQRGFGLGLSIVKELVEQSFGTMRVRSKVGVGSEFSFTVPKNRPAVLLREYGRVLKKRKPASHTVAMLLIEMASGCDTAVVDRFLTRCLRQQDVLIQSPVSDETWFVLTPRGRGQAERLVADVEQARLRNNALPRQPSVPKLACSSLRTTTVEQFPADATDWLQPKVSNV